MFGWVASFSGLIFLYILFRYSKGSTSYYFAGRTVLVTGGAGGLGKALVAEFSKRNCKVISCDLRHHDQAPNVIYVECDLSDRKQITQMIQETQAANGPIDILVNNAGLAHGKSLLDLTHHEIEKSFAVNVLSHFWLSKELLPQMLTRNSGHIVAVASVLGTTGIPRLTDYCASKAAVIQFITALRREFQLGKHDIGTTLVCPSKIATPMFEAVEQPFIPLLQPDQVARAIVDAVATNTPTLYLPAINNICFITKLLPTKWEDTLFTLLGMNETTKNM